MSGRVLALVGSIAVGAALFMLGARVAVPNSARAADDCLTAPNASAPQGSHWYYRTDRTNQRKCWYYRAPGESAQDATAQATPEATPASLAGTAFITVVVSGATLIAMPRPRVTMAGKNVVQ